MEGLRAGYAGLLSEGRIRHELDHLIGGRFVRTTRRGSFQRINGWMPLHKKIVAIELKLTRVTEVLHQAAAHLEFADESYVGLPLKTARKLVESRRKEEFREMGVGVLGLEETTCEALLAAGRAREASNPVLQGHCVERFWRTFPTDS